MIPIVPKPQKIRLLSEKQYIYRFADCQRFKEEGHGQEGYRLVIDNDGIKIFSGTPEGTFRAETTLRQLMAAKKLPNVEIRDYPRFAYRGFMLDCSRHFFGVETIKKQIEAMALLKMNYFHWHLTDDQGWRLESLKFPRLTSVGSKRGGTKGDGRPVEGYYTREQVKEIVAFAQEKYIEVVPEIDVPGHLTAAIAAYPSLSCDGAERKVAESFGIHKNVACAGKSGVVEMLSDILAEAAELFPGKYFHLGGDEAPRDCWEACRDCVAKKAELGLKDGDELQAVLMNALAKRLEEMGKTVINWNDGMKSSNVSDRMVMQYWKESRPCREAAIREAKKGRPVIFSPFFAYYLDYPYGMTSLEKCYKRRIGFKYVEDENYLAGVEAPLWTEYIDSPEKLEYNTYPRLCAVAERGWSNVKEHNYGEFTERLTQINKIFAQMGVKYATIKVANPEFIQGKKQTLKFFLNALRKKQK